MSHSVPLSFTPASHAGHQTIGKNGSFWLPPEMQNSSFDSHLKNQMKPAQGKGGADSSLVSNKQVLKPTSNISKGMDGQVTKKNTQVNHKPLKQIQRVTSESKKNAAETHITRTGISKSNPSVSKMISGNHNPLSPPLINQATSSQGTPTNSYINPNLILKPIVPAKYPSQIAQNPKSLEVNQARAGVRDGIKDAFTFSNADFLNKSKGSLSNQSKWSNSHGKDNSRFLYETALRKILPLFSRTSTEQTDIVRFASELPNGECVAMRIECNSKEISLVSICSNVAIHEDIASSSHDLLESLASLTNRKTSFQIFSSYEEFDQYHAN
jgi:hypothetical protein